MALSPRLEFRQSQTLTLTPQLMQSIRLLQLSHLELNDFVDTELLRNPLLEREEGGGDEAASAEPDRVPVEMSAYEDTVTSGERTKDAAEIAEGYDTAVENVFPDAGPAEQAMVSGPDRNGSFEGGEAPDLDQFVAPHGVDAIASADDFLPPVVARIPGLQLAVEGGFHGKYAVGGGSKRLISRDATRRRGPANDSPNSTRAALLRAGDA